FLSTKVGPRQGATA
ncbi:hypothetical protein, partial [Mycobacterium tuberculosis]